MKPRILYVEDDADTRELVTIVLTSRNCEVTASDDGSIALSSARTGQFDLYLMDTWIAGSSGIELCEKIREFDSRTPILFYSGAAFDSDRERALRSGAQGYLTKPIDNEELVAEVFRLISNSNGLTHPVPETNEINETALPIVS